MKIISFSATFKLQQLLNKECCQTIRPLWCRCGSCKIEEKLSDKKLNMHDNKKPRFKVSEKIKLMWQQRSPYKKFNYCSKCPTVWSTVFEMGVPPLDFSADRCEKCGSKFIAFNKILGEGEITEVFEIDMGKKFGFFINMGIETTSRHGSLTDDGQYSRALTYEKIARRDGFKTVEKMFAWFDEQYDLTTPKRFATYRWRWL